MVQQQPDNQQIIQDWIEKQRQAQWIAFKKQCVKEAQKVIKIERQIMNGEVGMRRIGPPKAIKAHDQYPPLKKESFRDIINIEEEKKKRHEKERILAEKKMSEMKKTVERRVQSELQKSMEMKKRQEMISQKRKEAFFAQSKKMSIKEEQKEEERKALMEAKIREELQRSKDLEYKRQLREQNRMKRLDDTKRRSSLSSESMNRA